MQTALMISSLAEEALLFEVSATPKPGLVDRANNGAHRDMDIFTFMASAAALTPYFAELAKLGKDTADIDAGEAFASARQVGIKAEKAMYSATNGVNTHKGAIFSVGLVCFAAGRAAAKGIAPTPDNLCGIISVMTKGISDELSSKASEKALSNGIRAYEKYRVCGARGEAESGFASVREISLPMLKKLLSEGKSINEALVRTLLALMAAVCDTNVISRCGIDRALEVKKMSKRLIGSEMSEIAEFDKKLIEWNASPGGCADLLSVTWLLLRLDESRGTV